MVSNIFFAIPNARGKERHHGHLASGSGLLFIFRNCMSPTMTCRLKKKGGGIGGERFFSGIYFIGVMRKS